MSKNTKKLEQALAAKGYVGPVEWVPSSGGVGVDGYCCDAVRVIGKSEHLGYSFKSALAYVETLPNRADHGSSI